MKRLLFTILVGGLGISPALAADGQLADAVNRTKLRVCATPSNLPYSDEKGQGFENKIAEIIADELKVPLEYYYQPQGFGFIKLTLGAKKCDLVIGTAQADEFTQNTNPYYRTTYALVYKPGKGFDGLNSLFDERLKDKVIGIQAGVPAADQVAKAGLMVKAKPYLLQVDTRYNNPQQDMVNDIRSGDVDVGVLWGPFAGYYANRGGEKLTVVPMLKDVEGTSKLEYRITMGVRHNENNWKHKINEVMAKRQADIDKVLLEYGVPVIDEQNQLVTEPRQAQAAVKEGAGN